ncbi:MAG: hypothetical protein E6H57_14575 [Betaproteobacteria bacterium]|nr:MAG: hypothetical protein E6H57_14575 [Betaproteobacteria bacterium]
MRVPLATRSIHRRHHRHGRTGSRGQHRCGSDRSRGSCARGRARCRARPADPSARSTSVAPRRRSAGRRGTPYTAAAHPGNPRRAGGSGSGSRCSKGSGRP